VSRIKQESDHMGPEGGVLSSEAVPMVKAAFPQGALTKKIRVGLQVLRIMKMAVVKLYLVMLNFYFYVVSKVMEKQEM